MDLQSHGCAKDADGVGLVSRGQKIQPIQKVPPEVRRAPKALVREGRPAAHRASGKLRSSR